MDTFRNLDGDDPRLKDESASRQLFESMVWPTGPFCSHCGERQRIKELGGQTSHGGTYKCYGCRRSFNARLGTIIEGSHIPLRLWLRFIAICSDRRQASSRQLAAELGISPKSARAMRRRVEEATKDGEINLRTTPVALRRPGPNLTGQPAGRTNTKDAKLPAFSSSRLRLILAAEQLYALQSFQHVSHRRIAEAAGVRNIAAVNYHFGSAERLLFAIFKHRFASINPRRWRALEQLSDSPSARDLIGAFALPLAEELLPRPEGNYYLRFVFRILREDPARPSPELDSISAYRFLNEQLQRRFCHLPEPLGPMRVRLALESVGLGLARLEEEVSNGLQQSAVDARVQILMDAGAAILAGDIHADTRMALAAARAPTDASTREP